MKLSGARSTYFDVVRSFAILAVVAVHTVQVFSSTVQYFRPLTHLEASFVEVVSFGKYGVELFFVLSGLLLGQIYANTDFKIQKFVANRARRIYPLWLVFAFLSLALFLLAGRGWWAATVRAAEETYSHPNAMVLFATLFLCGWLVLPDTAHRAIAGGWSIESEVAHYALFVLVRRFTLRVALICVSGCGVVQRLLIAPNMDELSFGVYGLSPLASLSIFSTVPFFILGVIVGKSKDILAELASFASSALNLVLLLICLPGIYFWLSSNVPFGKVFEAAATVTILLALSHLVDKAERGSKVWEKMSRHSYSMYFTHFWIVNLYVAVDLWVRERGLTYKFSEVLMTSFSLPIGWLTLWIFSVSITFLMGFPIYRFIELPFFSRKRS